MQMDKEIIYSNGVHCENVATGLDIDLLKLDQSEGDTIMISIYAQFRDNGDMTTTVLDSADTDVYVASFYAANKYPGEIIIKRGSDFINCKTLFDETLIDCVIPFHIMTGCDATSGQYGKGKGLLFEKLKSSHRARQQLECCGDELELTSECEKKLMCFTRELIYGDPHSDTMAEARALKWRSQKKKRLLQATPRQRYIDKSS